MAGNGGLPSGNQAWLAGKSPINGGFDRKITHTWSIFQHAMFDDTRGYSTFHFL